MIAKTSSSSPTSPNDTIFINHASGQKAYIISLTFPSITLAIPHLTRLSYGTDIWELRVDLLSPSIEPLGASNLPSLEYVKEQISLLQQHSNLPILFTIRTVSQGGKFPDDEARAALDMMLAAVEASCEYIDVEIEWPESLIEEVNQKKGNSKVVASFHDWTGGIRWSSEVLKEKYVLADKMGDIIKLSIFAADMYDAHELALFVRSHSLSPLAHKPLLAVGMGPHGQLSRATSPISIVTHSIMPPSAPGQLSLAQVHQTMHLIGQIPKRNFFIFGNNIAHSLSPALHNAGFAELGLPHSYSIHETENVDDSVQRMMNEPTFGGASVTFPHKLQVGKYLQGTSVVAGLIGAVNTVIVQTDPKTGGRVLWGDNTDWLGIKSCIETNWPLPGSAVVAEAAVVIGAGGAGRAACYAVQKLGAKKVYLVNRTRSKSDALAADFSGLEFEHYASLSEFPASVSPPPNIVVGCVPADDFTEADIPIQLFSLSMDGGVLVEMAYRPLETALTKAAKRFEGWKCARGTDVLKEQAYHQFKMWTGRRAPAQIMESAMNAVINAKKQNGFR